MAVGAGIGASLPRSRFEDRTLGSSSDAMVAEAQRVFRDEVHKARQALEGQGDAEATGTGGEAKAQTGTKGKAKRASGGSSDDIVTPV
jgi:hypothetical protein